MDKYIITNGKNYLDKRLRLTDKITKAVKVNSVEAAKNTLKSLPIESKKFNWNIKKYVEPTCDDVDVTCEVETPKVDAPKITAAAKAAQTVKEVMISEVKSNQPIKDTFGENNFTHTYVDIDDLKRDILSISNKISSMKNNKEYLSQELSNVDMAICDVMHYIELNNFNACNGYKLCKVLKILRLYRRKIKDELNIINVFDTQTTEHLANGHTYNTLSNFSNRKYGARVFNELFEETNISDVLNNVINNAQVYISNKSTI